MAKEAINVFGKIDILINNAAQTVRRPSGFYQHLMVNEELSLDSLPISAKGLLKSHYQCIQEIIPNSSSILNQNNQLPVSWHGVDPAVGMRASAKLSQLEYSFDNSLKSADIFPEGKLDAD